VLRLLPILTSRPELAESVLLPAVRFVASNTDDGRPLIRLELFHDIVAGLKSITVEFEVLSGTTLEQTRTLVDTMNERIIGVAVSPK
jgi:hypothetical protein